MPKIRENFIREMNIPDLGETPQALAEAARLYLLRKFLTVATAMSGTNFLIVQTSGVCVVESKDNGCMRLTLPETLITIAGINQSHNLEGKIEAMVQTESIAQELYARPPRWARND